MTRKKEKIGRYTKCNHYWKKRNNGKIKEKNGKKKKKKWKKREKKWKKNQVEKGCKSPNRN